MGDALGTKSGDDENDVDMPDNSDVSRGEGAPVEMPSREPLTLPPYFGHSGKDTESSAYPTMANSRGTLVPIVLVTVVLVLKVFGK